MAEEEQVPAAEEAAEVPDGIEVLAVEVPGEALALAFCVYT